MRVLPPSDRDAFQRRRAELDAALDAVTLPPAAAAGDAGADDDDKDDPAEDE
jgi:hypothetical protein